MSNLTGTVQELLYLSQAPGTAKNTFGAEVVINDTTAMGVQPELPANFWLPNNAQVGRAIKIVALVSLASTGTPTFTPIIRLGSAQSTAGPIVASCAALTTVSGAASVIELEATIQMVTRGASGANSTVRGVGLIKSPGFAVANTMLWGGAASPGTVLVDPSIDNYINLNFACGTNNAANQVQCQRLEVYGLN